MVHAPGEFKEHCDWMVYQAGHNLLLCHAKVVEIYNTEFRATQKGMDFLGFGSLEGNGKILGELGITISGTYMFPMSDSKDDTDACDRGFQFNWGWWANPIFGANGDYPQVMKDRILNASIGQQKRLVSRLPEFTEAQKQSLKGMVWEILEDK